MNIWLLADTHFGHDFLKQLGVRPQNYEQLFWDSWMKNVKSEDLVIHLGDLAFTSHTEVGKMIQEMPGKKVLVRGNHDGGFEKYFKIGFNMVCDEMSLNYGGYDILFSHQPKYPSLLEQDINIHGHLHGDTHRLQEDLDWYSDYQNPPTHDIRFPYVDMAPEIWGCRVVNLQEVIKKMKYQRLIYENSK